MVSRDFFRFNTTNTVSAETDDDAILDEVVALCDRYELLLSRVDAASELFRVNEAKGRPVEVDAELASFIGTALSYCKRCATRKLASTWAASRRATSPTPFWRCCAIAMWSTP